MQQTWQDCIVSYVDLVGVANLAAQGGSIASEKMREFHRLTRDAMKVLISHKQAYCWNDSALLLADWDNTKVGVSKILKEASDLIQKINSQIGDCYAVSIKGQTFPEFDATLVGDGLNQKGESRCVILKSSSYAMGNCFLVEEAAKETNVFSQWYIDSRLVELFESNAIPSFPVKLMPDGIERLIYRLDCQGVESLIRH
jgi:hypothetical protein